MDIVEIDYWAAGFTSDGRRWLHTLHTWQGELVTYLKERWVGENQSVSKEQPMDYKNLKQIINDLDFQKAFRRVKYDSQYDFIQLPVEVAIFEECYEDNIKFLKDSIRRDTYEVKSLRKIWVPKRNYFLRPGAIPHLDDRILFQAIVDEIALLLEEQVVPLEHEVVFSHRLHRESQSEKMFLHPRDLWLLFKKKAVNYCNNPDVRHVLESDIASYFENIDLRHLNDTLTSLGVPLPYVEAIRQILSVWANGRTRGIPQMIAPCSFLATVYLSQVDRNMVTRGYKYIRYVDDIRIFVSSEVELRQSLLELTKQLKNCYLDVQASKTKFSEAGEYREELTALERHMAEVGIDVNEQASISYFEQSFDQQIPEEKLVAFLNNLLENPDYDDRHLRFCINNLSNIGSSAALDLVLSKLQNMPQETDTFVSYLLRLPPSEITKETVNFIIDFLESEYNIYDWQMMWLLIFLTKCEILGQLHLQRLFRINKLRVHPINKAILSYLLCSKGDLTFKRDLISQYSQEQSIEVRMAILCGVFDLNKRERNRFYAVAGKERLTNQLTNILKNKQVQFL